MAAPHVAGVAALIISQTGMKGGAVAAALQQATNPLPCLDTSQPIQRQLPGFNSEAPQTCTGGLNHNSFYGSGEIDALQAVAKESGCREGTRRLPAFRSTSQARWYCFALELPPVAGEMREVALGVLDTVGDVAQSPRGTR